MFIYSVNNIWDNQLFEEGIYMNTNQKLKLICALLLVFMITISPVLAAEETKDTITVLKGDDVKKADDNEDEKKSNSDSDDLMDKIISDDKFLGYDRNKDYDISQDFSVRTAIDLATSLPPWRLVAALIMLLIILVLVTYIIVIQWNVFKGGKAATNENPNKAAEGIRNSKQINRAYTEEFIEGALFICGIVFAVMLFA